MSYFVAKEDHNEIIFESKSDTKFSLSLLFVGFVFVVFITVGYFFVPHYWRTYYLSFIAFSLFLAFVYNRRKKKNKTEFRQLIFSAQKGVIRFINSPKDPELTLAFGEIIGFDVFPVEMAKVTAGTQTTIRYNFAIRMNLTDSSFWLLTKFEKENEAETLANTLTTFCERNKRESNSSKGYVPQSIIHTRLGSANHEFLWTQKNWPSFLFFILVSLGMTSFFIFIISTFIKGADDWLEWTVAIVFSFFFLLVMLFIQVMEFPKQLQNILYTYECKIDRKSIRLDGIRKNGKRKIIFETDLTGNQKFTLSHSARTFSNMNERTLFFMPPRKEANSTSIAQNLKDEMKALREAKTISLKNLKIHEVLAFRNYLNEIVVGIRD